MPAIADAHVLIMATDRFEESELFGPREMLLEKGAKVTLASPTGNPIMATVHDEPGRRITPDLTIDEVSPNDYDALLLPGGVGNPDQLRMNERAVSLIRDSLKPANRSRQSATGLGCWSRRTCCAGAAPPPGNRSAPICEMRAPQWSTNRP